MAELVKGGETTGLFDTVVCDTAREHPLRTTAAAPATAASRLISFARFMQDVSTWAPDVELDGTRATHRGAMSGRCGPARKLSAVLPRQRVTQRLAGDNKKWL